MKSVKRDLEELGFEYEDGIDGSYTMLFKTEGGLMAMAWGYGGKNEADPVGNAAYFALLSPKEDVLYGLKVAKDEALEYAQSFKKLASEMTYWEPGPGVRKSAALRLDDDLDYYVQLSNHEDNPKGTRFVARSQKLRREDLETKGVLCKSYCLVSALTSIENAINLEREREPQAPEFGR